MTSFTATPNSVAPGEMVALSWEVRDASSVSIRTAAGVPVELADPTQQKGTVEVKVEKSAVYVLNAAGEGGNDSAATSVAVTESESAAPLFTVFPGAIRAGEKATIVWNAPGAARIQISDLDGNTLVDGNKSAGSVEVRPTFSTRYRLTADDFEREIALQVTPAITAFQSSATEAEPGAVVTLNWKAGGADTVTLSASGRGVLTTATDPSEIADGSFVDTVPANLPASGIVEYTLTASAGDDTSVERITVYVGADPVVVSFKVPPFVREGAAIPVSWKTALADRVEVLSGDKVMFRATTRAEVRDGATTLEGITDPTTVELRVSNTKGGLVTRTEPVQPVGVPAFGSFTATPNPIPEGGDALELTWDVTNARHVRVSVQNGPVVYEATGEGLDRGNVHVYTNEPTTWLLEADNTIGDAISRATASATVTSPLKLTFDPSTPVPAGAQVAITGTTRGLSDLYAVDFVIKNPAGAGFVDISSTGTLLPFTSGSTVAKLIDLPEPFFMDWGGRRVGGSHISVSENGWMVFSDTEKVGVTSPSTTFPSSNYEPDAFVPFGRDIRITSGLAVQWQLDGTAPNRRLIVQWTNAEFTTDANKKITAQVQLYETGEVRFAYKSVTGLASTDKVAIGVVDLNDSTAVSPASTQLNANGQPVSGDVFSFFGKLPLPYPVVASATPLRVSVGVPNGRMIVKGTPNLYPAGQFHISEVNYNPAAGKSQWFEVTNNTDQPVDLGGWTIDFGGGNTHLIAGPLVIPAYGAVVLGQDPDSADLSAGGAPVQYVYDSSLTMPTASGSVSLTDMGVAYTRASWTSAGTKGTALFQAAPSTLFASGTTASSCRPNAAYGSGQIGTPGTVNHCMPWRLSRVPGAFQPIAATGTALYNATTNHQYDSVIGTINFVSSGGRAVKIGNSLWGNGTNVLSVSSNGWVSMGSSTATSTYGAAVPSTSNPNSVLALFWADLAGNAGTSADPSGIYWQQFDPDGLPSSGDEYTLISWENWKRYSTSEASSLNFQLKIIEATGDVEYHYGTMFSSLASYANGSGASAWIESSTGTMAVAIGAQSVWVVENSGWRFTYLP